MRFVKGQSGNPKGRKPLSREKFQFTFLDETAIPDAIRHLASVVAGTHEDIKKMKGQEKVRLQNDAAKALLAKAPERHQGTGEDGAIIVQWLK